MVEEKEEYVRESRKMKARVEMLEREKVTEKEEVRRTTEVKEWQLLNNIRDFGKCDQASVVLVLSSWDSCGGRGRWCVPVPVYRSLIDGVYRSLVDGVYRSLVDGVYRSLIDGVYLSLIDGVYRSLIDGVYRSLVDSVYRSLVDGVCFFVQAQVRQFQSENSELREREQWVSRQLVDLESSTSSSLDSLKMELQEARAVREQEKLHLTQQLEDKQTLLQRRESELEEVRAELCKRGTKA